MGEAAEWSTLLRMEEEAELRRLESGQPSSAQRPQPSPPRPNLRGRSPPGTTSSTDAEVLRRSPRLSSAQHTHRQPRSQPSRAAIHINFFGRNSARSSNVSIGPPPSSAPATASARDASASNIDHMPELAPHERGRAMKRKPVPGPRGHNKAGRNTKETRIDLQQRLKEFPEQTLKISAGRLFCECCKEVQPNLKESLKRHIGTSKHKQKLAKFKTLEHKNLGLRTDLADYFAANPHLHSATLESSVHEFRCRVVRAFMISGTPLERLRYFQPILEQAGVSLANHKHLASDYVPMIETREFEQVKRELNGNFISISFDGTSRLGEAVNITGRWCSDEFDITMRLLRFMTAKKHLNAQQFASLLTQVVCTDLSVPPNMLVSMSRDSATVNGAACRLLLQMPFTAAASLMCISHSLNNVGVRLSFEVLDEFLTPWLELVGGRHPHPGAKSLWQETVAPQRVPGYSAVRWYSKAEIAFVIAENYHKLQGFLSKLDEQSYGEATRQKLHNILDSADKAKMLNLQLAAMLDLRTIVRTTYELEGDRLELLLAYNRIERLRALGNSIRNGANGLLPNLDAALRARVQLRRGVQIQKVWPGHGLCTAKIISSDVFDSEFYPGQERRAYTVRYDVDNTTEDLEEEQLRPLISVAHMNERKEVVQRIIPAFDYLESRITGSCDPQYSCVEMFRVCDLARAFDPVYAAQHLTPAIVDQLPIIKALAEHVNLNDLKSELPAYLVVAKEVKELNYEDIDLYSTRVLSFWRSTPRSELRAWRLAARIVFSMSPNSASCERVFSLMQCMFGEQQTSLLADYVQASLMLRYNGRCT